MHIGLIGLGKMGGNMRTRLRNAGHTVTGYDTDPQRSDVRNLTEFASAIQTESQRSVAWVMVPAGAVTRETIRQLSEVLPSGALVIDGGNSRFTDDAQHAEDLAAHSISYLDVGVSGGVWGLENGYALMVGGAADDVASVQPIFDALTPDDGGFVHAGPVGAGHFTKMVHNGVEYGLMQAYAEGYELLAASPLVENVKEVLAGWREGTVVRSWLLDLLVDALEKDPGLTGIRGFVQDSGEGRWTVEEAINHRVPAPVISAALFARFASRQDDSPAMKAVAALRNEFGGHAVKSSE